MAPTRSRSQRTAAFLRAADEMYERLETWYDAHPAATFEELEEELRRQRRELMGGALATLIVGRDSGYQPAAPLCPQCGQALTFEGYRPWTLKCYRQFCAILCVPPCLDAPPAAQLYSR